MRGKLPIVASAGFALVHPPRSCAGCGCTNPRSHHGAGFWVGGRLCSLCAGFGEDVSVEAYLVIVILHEQAWCPGATVTKDARFHEDMWFDDHDMMDFAEEIERRLAIHLPKPLTCNTVGEFVALIGRRMDAEERR